MVVNGIAAFVRAQWLRIGAAVAVLIVIGVVVVLQDDASMESAGEEGSALQVLTGGVRTVQHSTLPLPSAGSPQTDGLPTLVWFSATWCTTCASMDPFARDVVDSFGGRFEFVEKSIDHDKASTDRYGVRATPTFVLLNASGQEVSRFSYAPNADAFSRAIELALSKL